MSFVLFVDDAIFAVITEERVFCQQDKEKSTNDEADNIGNRNSTKGSLA